MQPSPKPSLFYGSAISTALGLALGLALHGPWQSTSGGPQILFPSAAAAELARPLTDNDIIEASAPDDQAAYADNAYLDTGQLPPNSLPLVRLTRRGGPEIADPAPAADQPADADAATQDTTIVEAAAEPAERQMATAAAVSANPGL